MFITNIHIIFEILKITHGMLIITENIITLTRFDYEL